jgi:4-hydroxythreonine-4-phosphate dehydrogenase
MKKNILITTGDADGIGLEVSLKGLGIIGPQKGVIFSCFYQNIEQKKFFRLLGKKFKKRFVTTVSEAIASSTDEKIVNFIQDARSPAMWVEEAAYLCLKKKISAMVTAPLSKPEIKRAGLEDLGHTDILKRICAVSDAYMCFLGKNFNVILTTGHFPLQDVSRILTQKKIEEVLRLVKDFVRKNIKKADKKPIAVLGLNPHAGDSGLIGQEEDDLIQPVIEKLRKEGFAIEGPLSPDSAFSSANWKKYAFYVATYHDQGLIPFKLIHQYSGAHLTLGLPILRTSPDHGVAKDIFGKNLANPQSMVDAIKWSIVLSGGSNV